MIGKKNRTLGNDRPPSKKREETTIRKKRAYTERNKKRAIKKIPA